MISRKPLFASLALLVMLAPFSGGPSYGAQATPKSAPRLTGGEKCFRETGRCMHGLFLGYWQSKGGVGQFGYPITDELEEGGRTVQYTERARFEWHRDKRDTPSEVLLSLLGNQLAAGRNEAPFRRVASASGGAFYFPETGHSLGDPFLTYWRANGGLPVYGYPISEAFDERNAADGKVYRVQYFERNRMEYHPEARGTQYEIQLGLLGKEFYRRQYGNAAPPPANPYPVSIDALQQMVRSGSDLRVVRQVGQNASYTQYAITYRSGNLLISGQMYVPSGNGPFPVMIMNHGYIPPEEYVTGMDSRRESPFVATNGFVAIHPDFRNYATSDDDENASENLTAFGWADDSLNLVDAVKRSNLPYLDKTRIGFWGHSNGGQVSMMALVSQRAPDIKAFVLFAPTSPDYADNFNRWSRNRSDQAARVKARHGFPEDNPAFYQGLSVGPHFKEAVTKGPVLLYHGTGDTNTPYSWSERSAALMKEAGINITFRPLPGENHLFSDRAWRGGVASEFLAFINRHVKGTP
jgi:dienelactone hydrolase